MKLSKALSKAIWTRLVIRSALFLQLRVCFKLKGLFCLLRWGIFLLYFQLNKTPPQGVNNFLSLLYYELLLWHEAYMTDVMFGLSPQGHSSHMFPDPLWCCRWLRLAFFNSRSALGSQSLAGSVFLPPRVSDLSRVTTLSSNVKKTIQDGVWYFAALHFW